MKRKLILSFIARTLVTCFLLTADLDGKTQLLDSALRTYSERYQEERAYLHYDKSAYLPGETIWFKAYLMKGILPAEDSKTLYVDWVDDKGTLLSHTSFPIVPGGVTNGQFDIPATLKTRHIHVHAYTKWMLNFDSSFIYKRTLKVIVPGPSAAAARPVIIPTLEMFPEGGDLVAGIKNKIAFKAIDQWGRPVNIKGIIQKDKIFEDSLRPLHDGMGFFHLIPQKGASYAAKWKDEKGKEYTTPLPEAKDEGISMQIGFAPTKRFFTVSRPETAPEKYKTLQLVGTMHQTLVFKARANLTALTTTSGSIPIETLPSGLLTITVFDNEGNAVAERITYINNNEYKFKTEINMQRWGLSKRARNEVELILPPNLQANLSVAVTDAGIETDSSSNIFSHLLLTADIRGYVHKPAYYFSGNSDSVSKNLDLVMLTNGWRRFKWADIAKGKLPVISYPKDSAYLSLSGKLFGLSPSQLQKGGSIIMMAKEKDSAAKMVMATVMPDGSFSNPDYIFFDSLRIYYQPVKPLQGASVNFMTSRVAAPNYHFKTLSSSIFPDTTGNYRHALLSEEQIRLQELLKGKMLEAVTVKAKVKPTVQVLDEKYASAMFKGDGYQFDVVNDPFAMGAQNIFNYLQGKVAGLQISNSGGTPTLQWRGGPPLIYLDEVSTDPTMVSGIPVQDIAYIKVLRPPFMMGSSGMYGNGSNGAIAIYTRKGSDMQNTPGKGLSTNTVMGYSSIKEFYSPNYASFDARNEQPDLRTTLYWKPQVITNGKNNKVILVFYNNDVTKAFRIIVEGMTNEGQLTRLEQLIE
jgi:hypothetical protein